MDKYLHFRYIKKNKNLHIIFDRDLTFKEYKLQALWLLLDRDVLSSTYWSIFCLCQKVY